jgi:hypothetical protein
LCVRTEFFASDSFSEGFTLGTPEIPKMLAGSRTLGIIMWSKDYGIGNRGATNQE